MTISATATVTAAGAASDPIAVLEDAIHAWVVAGSGLAASHVIWHDLGPIPSGPYIAMDLKNARRVSSDWAKVERTASNEIIHHVRGTRHPTLELTAFASVSLGSRRPESILDRVTAAYSLPSVAKRLKDGGVGVGTIGPIRSQGGMRGTMFDPRASIEITLHTQIDISEAGFAIESAGGASVVLGLPAGTIAAEQP